VLGDEGLEALKFSGFILLRGKGKLFAVRGGGVLSAECRVLSSEY
jgi:hypothetical protein